MALDDIVRDFRYSVRSLASTPVFTITVVLTLALGIGANTAIFSIVDRLLLRPLPYPNGEQLVVMHENGAKSRHMDVNPANWLDWQRESQTFESFAAWTDRFPATLTGEGEPEQLKTETASYEFFPILGVAPLIGRVFNPEDDRPQTAPTAVISYSLWQRKFARDPRIIGRTVQLNVQPVQIIGVMPAGFHFLSHDTDLWMPFGLDRNIPWRDRGGRFLQYVVARIKPSVAKAVARQEIETIAARLAQTYAFNKNTSVTVIPLREAITGEVRTSLLVLFAAVGVLLLIACSNVANLLIARSAHRRREIAIRTSLGAGRMEIIRQLVIESLVLATVGGLAGIFIARVGLSLLIALTPPSLLALSSVNLDQSMLLYTAALSLLSGIVVGLVPAMPAMRLAIADYLRSGGRSVTTSMRLRQALIVVQVTMTVVLLCGAGLLVRSLIALTRDPIGVNPTNLLTMRVQLPASQYTPPQRVAFFRQVTGRLRNLGGVQSAAAGGDIPVSTARISGTSFRIQGQPDLSPNDRPSTRVRWVTPGYFATVGIPLLKGRDFTEDDQIRSPQVFIVNEAFVKKFLPNEDPLSVSISVNMRENNPFGLIVGVAGDVKEGTLRGTPEPTVFYNHGQFALPGMTLFIRSNRGSEVTREAIAAVREMDRNLPVTEVRMLDDAFGETLGRERLNAIVSGAFAVSALLLASLGLYGLLAFSVAERTSEIGIRMALGAQASEVLRMIAGQGLRLVLIAAGIGLVAAFVASRFLESLLFGITAHDPTTFITVAALLTIVSLIAVLIPARRATQVDPLIALRED